MTPVSTALQAGSTPPPLLEREVSLDCLHAAFAAATGGTGRLVLVSGEPGIGKTALVTQFGGEQRAAARVLWGACDALFTPRPLGPFVEIAQAVGGDLHAVVGRDGKPHDVAGALLAELSSQPTILVLEDLHWADEASLDVLCLLARRIGSVGTLVVGTYRGELEAAHQLRVVLGNLAGSRAVDRLVLEPLSATAVAELAEPYEVDEVELFATTGGNPFFVNEVLLAGEERIPATVRDAVLARAAQLGPPARRALELVAVAHPQTELWLLEADVSPEDIDRCVSSGMLASTPQALWFRHELARLAVEESLAPGRARELQRIVLQRLQDPPSGELDFARLAHHAEGAGDGESVLRFAPTAAQRASSVGAHREAAAQYARALRFANGLPLDRRAALLNGHSFECYLTAQEEAGVASIAAAADCYRRLGSDAGLGATLRWQGLALLNWGRVDEALSSAHEAVLVLERVEPGHELAMSYNLLAAIAILDERSDEALDWASRGLELSERVDSAEGRVSALGALGLRAALQSSPEGTAQLEKALELAQAAELENQVGRAYVFLGMAASRKRSLAAMRRSLIPALAFCEKRDLDAWDDILVAMRGWLELEEGDWDATSVTVSQVLARHCNLSTMQANIILGLLRARRGDPDTWPPLNRAGEVAERTGQLWWTSQVAAAKAEAAWLEGKPALIAEVTEATFAIAVERRASWPVAELGYWRSKAGIDVGALEDARGPYAEQLRDDWARAAEEWAEAGCPYETALALAEGDDEALRRALDELNRLGARPAADIVARRMRERGLAVPRGPRPTTRDSRAGLTQRETEVMGLLADGLRNAEIADRLVLSRRTIDHHVSAILRKLDARTRGEAVAAAARLELSEDR